MAFLDTLIEEPASPDQSRRFDRQPLSESHCRAIYRWRHEQVSPSIWSGDRFLCAYGHHIEEFFLHCALEGIEAWALGKPPAWWDEDWSFEDLRSSDPAWAAEARRQPV